MRDASHLWRGSCERMHAAAPVLVHVLGNVDEVRKIAERAHDMQRLGDGQVVE